MRVLIATDAWHPQINGVVRTLSSLERDARALGHEVVFLTPDGFPTIPLPTYPGLAIAIPNRRAIERRVQDADPDAIHIATEGPIGHAARAHCLRQALPFTTSYATRFPEYIAARLPVPIAWTYAWLRRFHGAAAVTMVSTQSLRDELARRGFARLGIWTRGVDTDLFSPHRATDLGLPRPIFLTVGRIAIEKNLEAFLSLPLPGSKVLVGDGPQEAELRKRFPDAHFLGRREGEALAGTIAAADVFVFPSRTDTFGLVQLEALACGVPVAAFPVMGPTDVIGSHPVGALDENLGAACLRALNLSRQACRDYALTHSWEASARQFMQHIEKVRIGNAATSTSPSTQPV
jgi:glycosyltransferase involved in cell wall biosynthesis